MADGSSSCGPAPRPLLRHASSCFAQGDQLLAHMRAMVARARMTAIKVGFCSSSSCFWIMYQCLLRQEIRARSGRQGKQARKRTMRLVGRSAHDVDEL